MCNKLFSKSAPPSLRKQSGFTLVEVIVATMVIVVGILATVSVANVSVRASGDNERKVVGTNLAREGVELVRNIRDTNWQTYVEEGRMKTANPSYNRLRNKDVDWDCFPTDPPLSIVSCHGEHLSKDFSATKGAMQAVVGSDPATPDTSPYLIPKPANVTTKSPAYLLCLRPLAPKVYVPSPGTSCPTGKGYYRRVTIESRRGDKGSDNMYVRSAVTWEGQPGGPNAEIVVEEYLTNWRDFK